MTTTNNAPTQDWLALAARVLIALIFILLGANKIFDQANTVAYIESVGLPLPAVALWGAIIVELQGGLALLAGLKTRLVSYGLAAFSIVTALVFHNQIGDPNQFVQFFKNLAITGGLLQVAAFGPGRFSLDRA